MFRADRFSTLRASLGALAGLALVALLALSVHQPALAALLIGIGAAGVVRPSETLLCVVAFAPVARTAAMTFWGYSGRLSEAMAVAVGAAWLLRRGFTGESPARTAAPAMILAATVAASLLVQLAAVRAQISPEAFGAQLRQTLATLPSAETSGSFVSLPAAAGMLAGLLIFVVALDLGRAEGYAPRAFRMLVVGAAAAAFLNLARVIGGALRSETPWTAAAGLFRTVRVSLPYGDVNAAGSFFALAVMIAAAIVMSVRRGTRTGWLVAACLCGAGLWLSGSRAAILAILVSALGWTLWRPGRGAALRISVALAAAGVVLILAFPNPILNSSALGALRIRAELARTALRLTAQDPLFGIGIGQFYEQSAAFIRDPLVRTIYPRENAHNNFLQILAELGLVGLMAFIAQIWVVLADVVARLRARPDVLLAGAATGLTAFLLTCLSGHPLLTPEVSIGFWTVLGLTAGAASPPSPPSPPQRSNDRGFLSRVMDRRRLSAAALILIAVSVPFRAVRTARNANLENIAYGMSSWQFDATGVRYRMIAADEGTLFVPRDAAAVEVPLRLAAEGPPVTVDVTFRGHPADRFVVRDAEWRTYRLIVTRRADDPAFLPLLLKTVPKGVPLLVGKPVVRIAERQGR